MVERVDAGALGARARVARGVADNAVHRCRRDASGVVSRTGLGIRAHDRRPRRGTRPLLVSGPIVLSLELRLTTTPLNAPISVRELASISSALNRHMTLVPELCSVTVGNSSWALGTINDMVGSQPSICITDVVGTRLPLMLNVTSTVT